MKYIIENNSDLEDSIVFGMVKTVIESGKISNDGKQHCFATNFLIDKKYYAVYTLLNQKSEKFLIQNTNR